MMNPRLKLFIPLAIFAVLAILFWQGLKLDPRAMPSALLGKPVPEFSLPSLENADQIIDQTIFKDQVHLMNVWATWCPTCYAEHKYLVELAHKGVRIVGVNYKDDIPAARRWLEELLNPYVATIVDVDGRFGLNLGVFGAPETYVVDKQGIIRYKHIGVVDEKVWREQLEPLVVQLQAE